MNDGRSTLATVCFNLALLAWLAVAAGFLGIHAGVTKPFVGFRIFGFGLLASVPILVLSIVAMIRTRGAARREGRRNALRATLLSGALLVLFAVLAAPGAQVPAINDITTDPDDAPAFVEALQAPENQGRDPGYPATNAPLQRAAYPDLAPIVLKDPPDAAYAAAQRAATALGWTVVRSDPAGGALEATQTSRLFLFVDDVVVRVKPEDAGSRIDVRSRSRVGKGDVGANAARIRSFTAEVQKQAP
jgi:uncharacterized protein (DUF1499 family)